MNAVTKVAFFNNHSSNMNYFIYTSHHFTRHGRYELTKLTSLQMCVFIAQSVEQCTGIAEVTGSSPVEVLIFSGFFFPVAEFGKLTAIIILQTDPVLTIKAPCNQVGIMYFE